jgi:hypothetical protein
MLQGDFVSLWPLDHCNLTFIHSLIASSRCDLYFLSGYEEFPNILEQRLIEAHWDVCLLYNALLRDHIGYRWHIGCHHSQMLQ